MPKKKERSEEEKLHYQCSKAVTQAVQEADAAVQEAQHSREDVSFLTKETQRLAERYGSDLPLLFFLILRALRFKVLLITAGILPAPTPFLARSLASRLPFVLV